MGRNQASRRTWPLSLFEVLKLLHISCAVLSISGFALRGFWMMTENPRLGSRLARVLPHFVDTLLLASALGMLVIWGTNPLAIAWLCTKIVALLCYIGLGMVALRFGNTRRARVTAFWMALATAIYIVTVAYTKSPLGWLSS